MGFLKKIIKKAGRVVTSKSKTTRGVLKIGAVVAAPLIIGGTAAAIFGSRSVLGAGGRGDNSEQSTPEETGWGGGYSLEQVERMRQDAAQQGFFQGARQAGMVGGAGAAAGGGATMCADPAIVLEAVCKLCGG